MKTISRELTEAALVDGASRLDDLPPGDPAALPAGPRGPRDPRVHVHLQRLLLGADPDEDRRRSDPITSALNNLQGAFFTDHNQLAAGALLVALPTIVVYLVLSKQFVRGLTLGSTKG